MKKIIKYIIPNFLLEFYRIFKFSRQTKLLDSQTNFKNINYFNNNNILSELCEKYGTDKGFVNFDAKKPWDQYNRKPHTYPTFYHSIFNLSRENVKLVFECGLGTNNPNLKSNMTENGIPGASLRVWRDYFFNANIYGADIDKDILFKEEKIKTFYVDQLDTKSIKQMWANIGVENFDIIIEDGLHEPEANLNFFFNSFSKLKKNGVYVIEDVSNKYLNYLYNNLKEYDIEVVTLYSNVKKFYGDNNLIVIRKT
jgi:hypothetical protein